MNQQKIIVIRDFTIDLTHTLITFIRLLVLSKFNTSFANRIAIKNNACVILGNGPSLVHSLEDNTAFFENKDLICVNNFPDSDLFEKIKPNYFVNTAPEMWLENVSELHRNMSFKIFSSIGKLTTWPLVVFMPWEAKKYDHWQIHLLSNSHVKIVYFNNVPVEGLRSINHWLFRRNLGMPRPHNVLIPSIFLAINLSYKSIYLLGADHNWFKELEIDNQNNLLFRQKHFYDNHTAKHEVVKKNFRNEEQHLHHLLYKFYQTFIGYFKLREYAESRGAKIINATPSSMIDAFDRIELTQQQTIKILGD